MLGAQSKRKHPSYPTLIKNRRVKMKKYVTPDVTVVLLEQQDICTTSSFSNGNANFEDYGFDSSLWI